MKKKIVLISLLVVSILVLVFCLNISKVDASMVEITGVNYKTHVQNYGWQGTKSNGELAGTEGQSKRLEAIQIKLNQTNEGLANVWYQTHVQDYGWQDWKKNGELAGTEGKSKRLEAIRIDLGGEISDYYDILYRVHIENIGWQDWKKNGELAGTTGKSLRLEAIEIKIQRKPVQYLVYQTHVQSYGWQEQKTDGELAGTEGESKRLEAICIKAKAGDPMMEDLSIAYQTHVQDYGWQDWVSDYDIAGTVGESKRIEAIKIKIEGDLEQYFDINYRVHVQDYGWMAWKRNGETAGTTGQSKRIEAIEIYLSKKYQVTYWVSEDRLSEPYFLDEIHGENLKTTAPEKPVKTGYKFDGWETEDGELFDFNTTITYPIQLQARWTPIEYTITYNLDEGTNSEKNPAKYTIESNTINLEEPTKKGYTFIGWTYYGVEEPVESLAIASGTTGNIEITANWARSTYYVIYTHPVGGNASETKTDVVGYKDNYTMPTRAAVGNGSPKDNSSYYDFCWMGSDGEEYTPGSIYSKLTTDGLFVLTPMFKAIDYGINYTLNGGTFDEGQVNLTTYNYETNTFTLINPTRKGYTFVGWSGTGLTGNTNQTVTIPNGSIGARSYVANWQIINYGITYYLNNGVVATPNKGTYNVETDTFTLVNPTRENYVFLGWREAKLIPGGSMLQGDYQDVVTITKGTIGDKIYNASCRKAEYTVKYLQNAEDVSGITTDSEFYTKDLTCTLKENSYEKEGYTFKGWSTNKDAEEADYTDQATISRLSATDGEVVELYAIWAKTWVVSNEGKLIKYNGDEEEVVIPEEVDGIKITAIAANAFKTSIMGKLTLSEDITQIADGAISKANNANLTKIIMTNTQYNFAPISKEGQYGDWKKVLNTTETETRTWKNETNREIEKSVIDGITLSNVDYDVEIPD